MRGDQTTELYSEEVNKVFKATGSVKSLQFLVIKPNIIDDLLVESNKCSTHEFTIRYYLPTSSYSAMNILRK